MDIKNAKFALCRDSQKKPKQALLEKWLWLDVKSVSASVALKLRLDYPDPEWHATATPPWVCFGRFW